MTQYAVVANEAGKVVALFVHDPTVSRMVFKGPVASDLAASFDIVADRPVVRTRIVDGAMIRRKITPSEAKYLREKLDDMVFPPYRVLQISDVAGSSQLDDVADELEKEWFSK